MAFKEGGQMSYTIFNCFY